MRRGRYWTVLHSVGRTLWFLTALAFFLIIGKLTWRAPFPCSSPPRSWRMGCAGRSSHGWRRFCRLVENIGCWCAFLFWFLLGCFARSVIMWVAAHPWPLATAATAVVVATVIAAPALPSSIRVPVLAVSGIGALVAQSALASRRRGFARLGGYLARRTLAILCRSCPDARSARGGLIALRRLTPDLAFSSTWAMVLFVPFVTAGLVFVTTWFYDRCVPGRMAWLYQPPWRMGVVPTTKQPSML